MWDFFSRFYYCCQGCYFWCAMYYTNKRKFRWQIYPKRNVKIRNNNNHKRKMESPYFLRSIVVTIIICKQIKLTILSLSIFSPSCFVAVSEHYCFEIGQLEWWYDVYEVWNFIKVKTQFIIILVSCSLTLSHSRSTARSPLLLFFNFVHTHTHTHTYPQPHYT